MTARGVAQGHFSPSTAQKRPGYRIPGALSYYDPDLLGGLLVADGLHDLLLVVQRQDQSAQRAEAQGHDSHDPQSESGGGDVIGVGSLERFTAMYFEWDNVMDKPILGYGRNPENSYFYENVSTNFALTGGLVKLLAQYGLPLGIFLYLLLLVSSFKLNKDFSNISKLGLFFTFIVCSVSYAMFTTPIFTAFWFYGIFYPKERSEEKLKVSSSEDIMKRLRKSLK